MPKQKTPYLDTKIPPEKTKAEIELLLRQHRIEDIQWTSLSGEESLRFLYPVTLKGVKRTIGFELKPPDIRVPRRIWNTATEKYEKLNVRLTGAAWRLVYWYLKNKLDAIAYGLVTIEQELMAQIIIHLPDGETTLGQQMAKLPESLLQPALTSNEGPGRKAVEAEYSEVKN